MLIDECEWASMRDVVQMRAGYYAHVDNTRTQQRARSMLVEEADENKADKNERAMYLLAQKQSQIQWLHWIGPAYGRKFSRHKAALPPS